MRIALANQLNASEFAADDEHYLEALRQAGVDAQLAAWDDPGVDWASFDAVQVRTTWNYHEHLNDFLAWCRRVSALTHLENPAPLISWNAQKLYLRHLEASGIAIVPTRWFQQGTSLDEATLGSAVRALGAHRGFLKPAIGANASGTLAFELEQDRAPVEACEHLSTAGKHSTMMLQPYLSSVEQSGELSLIYFAGELSHCVRKVPKAGDYRVQDDHGATDFPAKPSSEALHLAQRCLRLIADLPFMTQSCLYARVDLMSGLDGRPCVGELELIEPSLFFRHDPQAAGRLVRALLSRLKR